MARASLSSVSSGNGDSKTRVNAREQPLVSVDEDPKHVNNSPVDLSTLTLSSSPASKCSSDTADKQTITWVVEPRRIDCTRYTQRVFKLPPPTSALSAHPSLTASAPSPSPLPASLRSVDRAPVATPARVKTLSHSTSESTPVRQEASATQLSRLTTEDYADLKSILPNRMIKSPTLDRWLTELGLIEQYRMISYASPDSDMIAKLEALAQGERYSRPQRSGRHWFEQLANLAESDVSVPQPTDRLQFFADPANYLAPGAIASQRKPDAMLVFPAGQTDRKRSFEHIAIPFEFTDRSQADLGRVPSEKYLQIIGYMRHTLVTQPLRSHVIGVLTFKTRLVLLLLDHELLRFCYVDDCWSGNAVTLARVAHLLLNLRASQAGFCPLAMYKCNPEKGVVVTKLSSKLLGDDETAKEGQASDAGEVVKQGLVSALGAPALDVCPVFTSSPAASPFSRTTCVFQPTSVDKQHFIIKFQHVDDERKDREVHVWRAISNYDWTTHVCSIPAKDGTELEFNVRDHLAAVVSALVCERFPDQIPLEATGEVPKVVTRRQTVVVYRNPVNEVKRLTDESSPPTPSQVVRVVKTLLVVLCELWTGPGVLHRDISTGNVLHSNGHLVLTDYDCAWNATLENSSHIRHHRTGTLNTMAVDVLRTCDPTCKSSGFEHEPRHDAESTVYTFLKVIWTHLRHQFDPTTLAFWQAHMFFDDGNAIARQMRTERETLWAGGSNGEDVVTHLTAFSPILGRLVEELLRDRLRSKASAESDDAQLGIFKRLLSVLDLAQADLNALDKELEGKWSKYSKA
ncbi:hypothetical protein ACM66B_006793 [Microbotryomycetes sp. NB124-2]